jgi:hypothetical protein
VAIKNYLVSAVRHIRAGSLQEKDIGLSTRYYEMYKLSLASCKFFLEEDFEPIIFTDPCQDVYECTKLNWYAIKKLWMSEPCNIFWLGSDTLMVKPTTIFNRFKEFRLFNYTDPKSYKNFSHYFNDDSRIFPHTMDPKVWELGEMWWENGETHPEKNWGFDQLRHNGMFWSQNIPNDDVFHPELNFLAMNLRSLHPQIIQWHEQWNNCAFDKAHILHFCASRGSEQVIHLMTQLCNQLEIKP